MTVETEVANLVTSVDNLTSTVNVRKATLDASVADAEGARDTALTYRDTTLTYKDQAEGHATTAAAEAANAASAVTWQDLAGLTFAFSETIVDGMVYDTTQDYDGGAWRFNKKASWYQEDRTTGTYLGEYADETAARAGGGTTGDCYYATGANLFYELSAGSGQTATTRAGSAEFPAVAYITAESFRVTIWDAQTGGMWMVFSGGGGTDSNKLIYDYSLTSLDAAEGVLLMGRTTAGLVVVNFCLADDKAIKGYRLAQDAVTYQGYLTGGILGRNTGLWSKEQFVPTIVNSNVNDVAITTLPNAPIDPATGLPKPTIAVATDGGVSIITDDGTVVDIASAKSTYVNFACDGTVVVQFDTGSAEGTFRFDIPAADQAAYTPALMRYNNSSWSGTFQKVYSNSIDVVAVDDIVLFGTNAGLVRTADTAVATDTDTNLQAHITSDYSTGWMPGDIKGAWLASTDDTDLVDTELVTNGTFDTDLSGWGTVLGGFSPDANNYWEWSAGSARVVSDGTYVPLVQESVLTAGETYEITLDVTKTTGNLKVASSAAGTFSDVGVITTSGTHTFVFVALADKIILGRDTGVTDITVDNISVTRADADRSVNANGLIVNGTVTKTAVATGAELVAYSGFAGLTPSTYLKQPVGPNLTTGTLALVWYKAGILGSTYGFMGQGSNTGAGYGFGTNASTGVLGGRVVASGGAVNLTSSSVIADNTWKCIAITYDGSAIKVYINGVLDTTDTGTSGDITSSDDFYVGAGITSVGFRGGSGVALALARVSATVLSPEQIRKIYNDEKWMFAEGAQVTLNGSSDAVTALAHDKVTDLLHVGTSGGMSTFDGLVRVSEDATAVTTSISANDSRIVRQ